MSEEGRELSQPISDDKTRVVDGITEHLRGGVWYKERKGPSVSSTQSIGIGNVRGRWTNGMEISAGHKKGREGGLRKR
jgi:hypothetical protein